MNSIVNILGGVKVKWQKSQRLKSLFVDNDYGNENNNNDDDDDIEVIPFSESEKTKHVFSAPQCSSVSSFSSSPTTSSPFAIFKLIEHKINTLKERGDTIAQATLLEGLTDQVLSVLKTAQQNASNTSDLASLKAKALRPFLENSQDLEQKLLVLDPVGELIEEVIQLANPKRNDTRSDSTPSPNSFAFSSQNKQFKGRLSDQFVSSSGTSPSTSFSAYASNSRYFGESRWKLPKIESKGGLADKNKKVFKFGMDEPKVYYVEHKTVSNVRPQQQSEMKMRLSFWTVRGTCLMFLLRVKMKILGITAAADKDIPKSETREVSSQLTSVLNQVNKAAECAIKEDHPSIAPQQKASKSLHEPKQQVKTEPASNSPSKTVSPVQPASILKKKKNENSNEAMDVSPS
uniref:Uncharacterized protein n=1 Tax=Ditylenchus dipsaci TaxID=166011 RepID=A0A915E8I6_9BILA